MLSQFWVGANSKLVSTVTHIQESTCSTRFIIALGVDISSPNTQNSTAKENEPAGEVFSPTIRVTIFSRSETNPPARPIQGMHFDSPPGIKEL